MTTTDVLISNEQLIKLLSTPAVAANSTSTSSLDTGVLQVQITPLSNVALTGGEVMRKDSMGSHVVWVVDCDGSARILRGATQAAESSATRISPDWLVARKRDLQDLRLLPDDWDSYGAAQIELRAIRRAETLLEWLAVADLPSPDVFPTVPGGVQIEWHIYGLNAEIEVAPAGDEVQVFYQDLRTLTEWVLPLSSSGAELRAVRTRLLENV